MGSLLFIFMYFAVSIVRFRVLVRMVRFYRSYSSWISSFRTLGKALAYFMP
jgi:hypothetical protein